jgi:hypothetical protein
MGGYMVSITYRISIPRSVVEMLEKINIPVNKDTFKEMTELYVKIKSSVPQPKADEMIMLYTELERNGTLTKAWEIARKISSPKEPMVSKYDVIKTAVDTYDFLISKGLKVVPETIKDMEELVETVKNIVLNSNEYKQLPDFEKAFIANSLPYFAFHTLVLSIFKKWIEQNPEKVLEITKQVFFNKDTKEEEIAKNINL